MWRRVHSCLIPGHSQSGLDVLGLQIYACMQAVHEYLWLLLSQCRAFIERPRGSCALFQHHTSERSGALLLSHCRASTEWPNGSMPSFSTTQGQTGQPLITRCVFPPFFSLFAVLLLSLGMNPWNMCPWSRPLLHLRSLPSFRSFMACSRCIQWCLTSWSIVRGFGHCCTSVACPAPALASYHSFIHTIDIQFMRSTSCLL